MEKQSVYMHEFWRGYDEDGDMEYVLSTLTYLSYEWRLICLSRGS